MVLTRARSRLVRAQQTTKPFRILDLPSELVLQIFEHFAEDDRSSILTARSACRAFRDYSIVAFGKNFFNHLVAMLHPLSLTTLLEIAKHKELSNYVHKLTISGERIGGVINVHGQRNEAALIEQQTAMENAKLDVLILTDVLQNLRNLHTIEVGSQTYHFNPESSEGARCGRRHIIEHGRSWGQDDGLYQSIDRAYGVTLASIKNTGGANNINLQLDVPIADNLDYYVAYFDPKSLSWVKNFSDQVSTVRLRRHASCPWAQDLLRSMRNLKSLSLEFSDETIDMPTSVSGAPFVYTQLCMLELEDSDCNETLMPFLNLHSSTLTHIHFNAVALTSGTWKDVFPIMGAMSKLEDLMLSSLEQQTSAQRCHCFDRYYDADSFKTQSLFPEDQTEIAEALEAVLYSYRTIESNPNGSHRVDFRLANAVLDGRVELGKLMCGWLEDE